MTDTIVQIPLEQLHESPFNPRLIFGNLEELAASIRTEGRIHEPLLVRPLVDSKRTDGTADDQFEIVFGHRRYRAAPLAGLASVPCMVRALTDAEARAAQVAENLQRRDIHPLEEAFAFAQLVAQDGLTAKAIAEQQGKSESYVCGRLRLNDLIEPVRQVMLAGEVGAEAALLVARLRNEAHQAKALHYIKQEYRVSLEDGGKASYRAIRNLLAEKFALDLKGAIFPIDDATLLPLAGSCTDCAKRTGNAPDWADLAAEKRERYTRTPAGADVCTDPDCFAEKKKAHLARKAAELAAAGKMVVNGGKARAAIGADGRVKGAYIALADVREALKKAKGESKPEVVTIIDQRTGKAVQAVERKAAEEAKLVKPEKAKPAGEDFNAKWRREQAERQQRAEQEEAARARVLDQVIARMAARPRDEADLALVARALWQRMEYGPARLSIAKRLGLDKGGDAEAYISKLHADELGLFCMLMVLGHEAYDASEPDAELRAAAERYGVDVEAARAEPAEPTGEAAPAPKKGRGKARAAKQTEQAEEASA